MRQHTCVQDNCAVAVDGQCLEGLLPDECPYHRWIDVPEEPHEAEVEGAENVREDPKIVFGSGDYLDASSARELTRRAVSRVIVLAGEVRSGKTAVLASLMEAFHQGPFASFVFAGSRTLPGFDQICHHARMASGRVEPFTPRTSRSEDMRFLHLDLVEEEDLTTRHTVLLSDVSGEAFEAARTSVDDAGLLAHFGRADHVLVLVDGRKILIPSERHTARTHPLSLIRNLLDAGVLDQRAYVDIAISKWDLIAPCVSDASIQEQIRLLENDARVRFGHRVGRLRFLRIAAQPRPIAEIPSRFGLDSLLRDWVAESPRRARPTFVRPALPLGARHFARFRG